MKQYDKIPIVDAARRCGVALDSRTLRRREVEATCPFCHDHGPGKYHLSLNTATDQYRCHSSIETTRKYLHKNEEIEREAIESMSNHLSMENLLNTPQLNGARKRGKFAGVILPDFSDKGKASGQ